jgi:protein-tyrosine phosphatase
MDTGGEEARDIAARDLDWEGCDNVRDLGGLRTAGGGETVRGRVIRANDLDLLTRNGWQAAWDFGVRTVIDLRNAEECKPADVARPAGMTTVRVPFDAYASAEWIGRWWPPGLPNNLSRYLADYPQALIDFGRAVACAAPGGIVVHCAAGRDRTGLAAMMLLVHAGVDVSIAAADWEHSIERLKRYYAREGAGDIKDDYLGDPDPGTLAEVRGQVARFLATLRTEEYFGDDVRARLVG